MIISIARQIHQLSIQKLDELSGPDVYPISDLIAIENRYAHLIANLISQAGLTAAEINQHMLNLYEEGKISFLFQIHTED